MERGRAMLLLAVVAWAPVCGHSHAECGVRPLIGDPIPVRVIGGQEALQGAWPWQVSVQVRSRGKYWHICGGMIIDRKWMLTAAHCFTSNSGRLRLWVAVTGLHCLSNRSRHTRVFKLRRIILHPGFESETLSNDIALLQLDRGVVFDDYTQPVCLPGNGSTLDGNKLCYITGWGSLEPNGPSAETLQEAELMLIPNNVCNRRTWYNGIIKDSMLCAGSEDGSVDTCQGDSGGPLQCFSFKDQRFYLLGISSFGVMCGLPRKVGVYTRLTAFRGWIDLVKYSYSSGGSPHWPLHCLLVPLLPALRLLHPYLQ